MRKWFVWPALLYVAPVPVLVFVCAWFLFKGLSQGRPLLAFLAVQGLFVLSYVGLLISFFPYIVPSSVTLWQAAACQSVTEDGTIYGKKLINNPT